MTSRPSAGSPIVTVASRIPLGPEPSTQPSGRSYRSRVADGRSAPPSTLAAEAMGGAVVRGAV
ncbi:MAG: hypothetical protein EBS51_15465 [Planctomycetia bacterium]|nr:hypothetical protein [Planctomycetia bacterium]